MKDTVRIRKVDPLVGQGTAVQCVERFEDPEEIGDSQELIGTENTAGWIFLHLIVRAISHPSQKLAGVLVSDLPMRYDVKKALQSRST
jgi:hypothetical protein